MNRPLTIALVFALAITGCCETNGEWRRSAAPHIEQIVVPDWPPLGPDGEVKVVVTDDGPGVTIAALFVGGGDNRVFPVVNGLAQAVFLGEQLGEGYGELVISATDGESTVFRRVENLLVDLTPPVVQFEQTIVSQAPGTQFEVWAADDWVLGSVTLRIDGQELYHELAPGFPSTFGLTWDTTLVSFPTESIREGAHSGRVIARDAAGNEEVEWLTLLVDGTAPVVQLSEPLEGQTVSGALRIAAQGEDVGGGAISIEVFAGGGLVHSAPADAVTLDLATSDFAPGELSITAVAVDLAGNRSVPASAKVWIEQ